MSDKILVVIDVQNDFVTGSLGSPAAVAVIGNICAKIKNFEGDIVLTQDTHYDYYPKTQEGQLLPVVHCQRLTKGWRIEPSVLKTLKHKKCNIVTKSTFGTKLLADQMIGEFSWDIEEIIIIGLVTDICVITNALLLKTAFPEITITVDASCCAGTTPENHAAALQVMRSCQVNVINDIPNEQPSFTTCKFGYHDCVLDPGYIWETDKEWYAKLYHSIPFFEVGCPDCVDGERYDDEDK